MEIIQVVYYRSIFSCITFWRNIENLIYINSLIFCLDYNATYRVGPDMQVLLEETTAKKIMIDHHLSPEDFPMSDLTVGETLEKLRGLIPLYF